MTRFGATSRPRPAKGKWDFAFNVDLPTFSPDRAGASWLHSAYLAVLRGAWVPLVVRERFKNPETKAPGTFRIIRPERSEPTLVRIEEPEA